MGNKHTLEDDLITFKLTSKQLLRSSEKCEKNAAQQKSKLKQAIEKGNKEGARIYAQNAIREHNQGMKMLAMSSRIDAVASRLEGAIRMQSITKAMGMTVKGMTNAMKTMDVEQISKVMNEFEKSFEDMDVRSGYMENAMDNTTSMTTPPEQVDTLIAQVGAEHGLEVGTMLDSAGNVGSGVQQNAATEQVSENDSLEARLAALRK